MIGEHASAEGDVVVCGSIPAGVFSAGESGARRLCFASSLDCRADLEKVLRQISRQPHVRHVVFCGDDRRRVGEALLSVLHDGVDGTGRLRGSRGTLSGDLDAKTVDAIRRRIHTWDWRPKPFSDVVDCIDDFARLPAATDVAPLPEPELPRRKVFLSRKTSFPIFCGDIGDGWLQLLNLVLKIGTEKECGGERFAQALNTMVTVGLPVLAEDLEVGSVESEEHAAYLDFAPEDFAHYFDALIFKPPLARNGSGDRFGARLHELQGIGRFESVAEELADPRAGGTSSILFQTPTRVGAVGCAPGILSATFEVADHALFGSFLFRSLDVYADWPFEAMALARLQRLLAERLGLDVGASTFVLQEAHLFARDWQRAKRVVDERFRRPLPLQVDHSGVFLFGNDGGKARAMLLDHDAGTIFWEDAFDNAQQLSWFIVDAMPWLLPQHIRYVGQECSTLARAMEEKACYLQG